MEIFQLKDFHDKLDASLDVAHSLDLATGEMGICIYYYTIGNIENNRQYIKKADDLLSNIFSKIDILQTIDLKFGLTGIGVGVNYLIEKKYIRGNVNDVLIDIDDKVFKILCNSTIIESYDSLPLIYILYYLYKRLKNQKKYSEQGYLFQELIIQTINQLYYKIDHSFFCEPLSYSFDYKLPLILFVLRKIYSLSVYDNKIKKILDEFSFLILSIYPKLNANRLYLWYGMDKLADFYKNQQWSHHIKLLQDNIDLGVVFEKELKNKNIYFSDGLCSILYLIEYYDRRLGVNKLHQYKDVIKTKIKSSDIWTLVQEEPSYLIEHRGLYNGICGILLVLKYFDI